MAPETLTCTAGCVMEPLPERNSREGVKFSSVWEVRQYPSGDARLDLGSMV